jgi:hypothetical protein
VLRLLVRHIVVVVGFISASLPGGGGGGGVASCCVRLFGCTLLRVMYYSCS